jgi:hypothetical protein
MDASLNELFTDRELSAGLNHAGKKYAAGRAAELLAEDPARTAQDLVDLLREEARAAGAAGAEFEQARGGDS